MMDTVQQPSEPVQETPAPEEEPVTPDMPVSDDGQTEAPVEVVSVDELVDRLTAATEEPEAEEPEPVEEVVEPVEQLPMEIVGMDELLAHVETLQLTVDHPALDTPFDEYTVMEGLLLLFLVLIVLSWCVKMLKGGFSWLLW